MARCAGCSSFSVSHSNTNCIHLTGDGTSGTPLIATLQIDPASPSAITCGPAGLSVAGGGGGGGGNVIYFTVGTPGVAAFAGTGATPPTLFAAADFQGDGVNDSVAIQAALNASAALTASSGVGAIVLILPGIYVVNTPLQPKGIPIIGSGPVEGVIFYTATFIGAPANTRTIDATISGSQFVHLENVQINALTGGAAVIKGQGLYMLNCAILGDGKGADAGLIDVGAIANPISSAYGRFEYNTVSGTSSPFPDPGLIIRDPLFNDYVINHNTFTADVVFTGSNHNNVEIVGNIFQSCSLIFNTTSLTRFKIRENRMASGSIRATLAGGSSFYWNIVDNIIEFGHISIDSLIVSKIKGNTVSAFLAGNGIEISNGGEHIIEGNAIDQAQQHGILLTTAHTCVVVGNRIRFYSSGTANTYDGIRIVTSDESTVECNSFGPSSGKYGINVVSGNRNFVTNNRINGSAITASLNDTATGTITVAGNYL